MAELRTTGYSEAIGVGFETVRRLAGNARGLANTEDLLQAWKLLYELLRVRIHEGLALEQTAESEAEIRALVRRVISEVLPTIEMKIRAVGKARERDESTVVRLQEIYDNYYALAAFRSLKHFALYMEWDKADRDCVWKYNMNCFAGYWYWANAAVLDAKVKFIEKQCPTGYGKSYSDTVTIGFAFGYKPGYRILKITGNPTMVRDGTRRLIDLMCHPRYAKVFPYYAKFAGQKSAMFDVCQTGGNSQPAQLTIHGQDVGISFMYINKETPIMGTRWDMMFLDDITKEKDKHNFTAQANDIQLYEDSWNRRKDGDWSFVQFASGTTWSQYDILCHLKGKYGGDDAVESKKFKYTAVNAEKASVFVSVPKLDFETDESTFPHKYSTEQARADRDRDFETFMAMDQQRPQPPEGTPFTDAKLHFYSYIPEKRTQGCWAMLDTARTGANYIAMPICAIGEDGLHYLKDCIYLRQPMEETHASILAKIEQHHITRLHIERNTDTSLATLLKKMLADRGITYCDITEIYSTKQKDNKIADEEATIRNNVVFPQNGLYAASSQMGRFMLHIKQYSYITKNAFDDAPDSVAMYAEKFIGGRRQTRATVTTISRRAV